ncbi:nitroreductase family protein [Pelotomaculum isophthalicicum JI]|uniref:Nitroreductase family protein n=1 Tax=Pelotomaculum isophthalicicum JI TaxID=947010 RepID=A0A9X4H0R0_9FIRM|nr:nitroreductase family protein [Pelotomaculum isophthalicicum]MDF9410025.1 nitroreductase family protein [Pelotomaculum isophthalicicum JI]
MNNLFEIDPNKCRHDGICVAECPLQLITTDGKDELPTPADKTEIECVSCGHCVTVCPHGAFTLKTMKPEECAPLDRKLLPTAEQAKLFLTARRSIRTYKKQPVDRATLSDLIDTARYAPTAVNTQPVNWLVIEDAGEVNRLAGLVIDWMRHVIVENPEMAIIMNMKRLVADWDNGEDRICRGAPHVIVAHAPAALASAQSSCTIALTYLELAAFSKGLGACWAGYFNRAADLYPPMTEALQLPEGHHCFGAMLVGYPQYQYHRIPLRKKAAITWR